MTSVPSGFEHGLPSLNGVVPQHPAPCDQGWCFTRHEAECLNGHPLSVGCGRTGLESHQFLLSRVDQPAFAAGLLRLVAVFRQVLPHVLAAIKAGILRSANVVGTNVLFAALFRDQLIPRAIDLRPAGVVRLAGGVHRHASAQPVHPSDDAGDGAAFSGTDPEPLAASPAERLDHLAGRSGPHPPVAW